MSSLDIVKFLYMDTIYEQKCNGDLSGLSDEDLCGDMAVLATKI